MANSLSLSLNDMKGLNLDNQAKNIITGIGDAFSNAVKKGTEKLSLPDGMFQKVKEGFEKINLQEIGGKAAESALKESIKTIIREGKNFILEQTMGDELKSLMKKQQNTISRINKKCTQMEEAFKSNDVKTLDRLAKTLKSDVEKVMPIQEVINKGVNMINRYELFKNKNGTELSNTELEICQKLVL